MAPGKGLSSYKGCIPALNLKSVPMIDSRSTPNLARKRWLKRNDSLVVQHQTNTEKDSKKKKDLKNTSFIIFYLYNR